MLTAGHLAATAIEILGIFALFHRFGPSRRLDLRRGGRCSTRWSTSSFSIADLLSRGFDVFGTDFVRTGAFDRVLLQTARRRAAARSATRCGCRALGRLLQASRVLVLATQLVPIDWDAAAVAIARLGRGRWRGACSPASWSCRPRSPSGPSRAWRSSNVLTYGGVQAAQYPPQHLRRLVPAAAHLRRAARLRGLLPGARHPEATGSARRARTGSCRSTPIAGLCVSGARRSSPGAPASRQLRLDRQLRPRASGRHAGALHCARE